MRADVLIVGGGASGSLVAAQLLRVALRPLVFAMVERSGRFSQGLAYATREPAHLLNVPAEAMSAWPDLPGHFLAWLRRRDPMAGPRTFAPRHRYGEYLAETLTHAQRSSRATLIRVPGEVVDLAEIPGGLRSTLADGSKIDTSFAVLALGNQQPSNLSVPDGGLYESELYRRSPWVSDAFDGIPIDGEVLLLGSGLTMVDAALSLRVRGHRGPISALSRHGLLPLRHERSVLGPLQWAPQPGRVRSILRQIRVQSLGRRWRDVIDGLRPITQDLWATLSDEERARFLRHARAYWEVHRHRMPPQAADGIEAMRATGQLRVIAGRVASLAVERGSAIARITLRSDGTARTLRAHRVINCTGPATLKQERTALVDRLLARGLARLDKLGLGLDAEEGMCLDARGCAQRALLVAGPLLRGTLWETTAIPELRVQAEAIAQRLHSQFELEFAEPESALHA
jgi:uncharacterized NAD(P)/FAD-binding protein YdhS